MNKDQFAWYYQFQLHDPESIDVNRNRLTKRQSSYDTSLVRCSLNVIADYKFYSFLTDSPSTQTRIAQATALIRQIIADVSWLHMSMLLSIDLMYLDFEFLFDCCREVIISSARTSMMIVLQMESS